MKRKKNPHHDRALSGEDRVLWSKVKRTVSPMHGEDEDETDFFEAEFSGAAPNVATPASPQSAPPMQPFLPPYVPTVSTPKTAGPSHLERPVHRKIARGRLDIDATIDLHNLNQDQAHIRLIDFVTQAKQRGCRHVLVITGKGSGPNSTGILRRMLSYWLETPPLAHLISGFKPAARHHGGDGAFYVRIKRDREIR